MLIYTSKYQGYGKQKPKQWGNISDVRSAVLRNAARLGIDPAFIQLLFPFWEGAGSLAYDLSSNANHGIINAGSWLGDGLVTGNAIQPVAINEIQLPAAGRWSVSAVITTPADLSTSSRMLLGKNDNDNFWTVSTDSHKIQGDVNSNWESSGLTNAQNETQAITFKHFGNDDAEYPNDFQYIKNLTDYGVTGSSYVQGLRINTIGNGYATTAYTFGSLVKFLFVYTSDLPSDSILRLHETPYALLAPTPQPVIFDLGAAGTTITLDKGSLSTTGKDAYSHKDLLLSKVTLAVTGKDLVTGLTLPLSTGEIALSNELLFVDKVINQEVGNLSLTGKSLTITAVAVVNLDKGTISITNEEISLDVTLYLEAGDIQLSGEKITINGEQVSKRLSQMFGFNFTLWS
jgi:hypothetical protein